MTRIGLSATQRPIETVARFLVGAGAKRSREDGSPRCEIVDVGHRRALDLRLELPEGELEAVASAEQMDDVLWAHTKSTRRITKTKRIIPKQHCILRRRKSLYM